MNHRFFDLLRYRSPEIRLAGGNLMRNLERREDRFQFLERLCIFSMPDEDRFRFFPRFRRWFMANFVDRLSILGSIAVSRFWLDSGFLRFISNLIACRRLTIKQDVRRSADITNYSNEASVR